MVKTFEDLMNGFGVVTVMDACIYHKPGGYGTAEDCCSLENNGGALTPSAWKKTGESIQTLKIANINQEGPTKTITGGKYSTPLIKYGKTTTLEMQDALGRASTLVRFFGCKATVGKIGPDSSQDAYHLSVTDKFPGAFAIEGKTFFINQASGEKEDLYILIPQFMPDAILNLTQDAEGDATVFDLNGTVAVTKVADKKGAKARDIFYEIRNVSFFLGNDSSTAQPKDSSSSFGWIEE